VSAASARAATVTLAPVGTFDSPVYVTAPPGDAHRIFVVEKTGAIQIVKDGQKLAQPFLSLAGKVSGGSEQGLLSMAFAPDYATSTDLVGAYVYGDYCTGEMWSVSPPAAPHLLGVQLAALSSFGEDSCGHVYATSSASGQVVRLTGATATPCPGGTSGGGGGGGAGGAARTVTLAVRGHVRSSGRAALRVGCSGGFAKTCRVTLSLRHGDRTAAHTRTFSVAAGGSRTVHVQLVRSARRSLARHRRLAVRASAIARDATGSARTAVGLTLRRG
jgi:hypothetical protein